MNYNLTKFLLLLPIIATRQTDCSNSLMVQQKERAQKLYFDNQPSLTTLAAAAATREIQQLHNLTLASDSQTLSALLNKIPAAVRGHLGKVYFLTYKTNFINDINKQLKIIWLAYLTTQKRYKLSDQEKADFNDWEISLNELIRNKILDTSNITDNPLGSLTIKLIPAEIAKTTMEHLQWPQHCTELYVDSTQLTNVSLSSLPQNLVTLSLTQCLLNNEDFEALPLPKNLKWLNLSGNKITEISRQKIKDLNALEHLQQIIFNQNLIRDSNMMEINRPLIKGQGEKTL